MSACRQRDRLEVALDVVGQLRYHVAGDSERADRPHAERVAVGLGLGDRKSTRLNSSHLGISYAVFCLKKKKKKKAKKERPHQENTTIKYLAAYETKCETILYAHI